MCPLPACWVVDDIWWYVVKFTVVSVAGTLGYNAAAGTDVLDCGEKYHWAFIAFMVTGLPMNMEIS